MGPRRAQQARATRRRIIDQAAKLFIEQGYAATTLDQISTAAGVAVQTVYFHFRNKATVLKGVVDVAAGREKQTGTGLARALESPRRHGTRRPRVAGRLPV